MSKNYIDFENNFINYENNKVHYVLYDDEFYFKGKSIVKLLGYVSPKIDLINYTNPENLFSYDKINKILIDIDYDKKNILYVNETGLDNLISMSNYSKASVFLKWIRVNLIYFNFNYISELNNISQELTKQYINLEDREKKILEHEKDIKESIYIQQRDKKNYIKSKVRTQSEIIYIISTRSNIKKNIYKFGKILDINNLLNTINLGKNKYNKMFLISKLYCYDSSLIEQNVKNFIKDFRIIGSKDTYKIDIEELIKITTSFIDVEHDANLNYNMSIGNIYENLIKK